jgi:hypothetical protein
MPLSSRVEYEIAGLRRDDLGIARLARVLAKAPYQVDARLAEAVLGDHPDPVRFIRILAWGSHVAARRFAAYVAAVAATARAPNIRTDPPEVAFSAPRLAPQQVAGCCAGSTR